MEGPTRKVAVLLFTSLWACIGIVNLLGDHHTPVPSFVVQSLAVKGTIARVDALPEVYHIELNGPVRIVIERGPIHTKWISCIRHDSTATLDTLWNAYNIPLTTTSNEGGYGGEILFLSFIIGGIAVLWYKAKTDRRDGSIRQRIEEAKVAYERGEIDDIEFARRMENLSPLL